MLGTGNPASERYVKAEEEIKQSFNFRTWQKDTDFDYCGAQMSRGDDGAWNVSHSKFIRKIKPMTLDKNREAQQPLSAKEQSDLRGLLGSLQWPAVQSSPHLQATTSLLSGMMSSGTTGAILEANSALRFAKDNSDVHLRYDPLGDLKDLRLATMFDAALGVRHDGSSQGGYIILMVHKDAFAGIESSYHVMDWRSFKLPRVAQSSLAAEAQAAGQAVDATDFVVRYWHMLFNPTSTLKETLDCRQFSLAPTLITDAKALYDSFHRETINHSATDRRTSLEIRVMKEQVQSMGGSFRWISSERQFGDGFTKLAARQLLADRVRHHKVKFTWDPDYVAAKKKSASARAESRMEFTTTSSSTTTTTLLQPKTKCLRSVRKETHERRNEDVMGEDAMMYENPEAITNDLPMDENLVTEIEQRPENDLALENTELAAETFVHENEEIVDLPYVQPYVMPTVETFASHVGPCIKYVMMCCVAAVAKAEPADQCSLEETPLQEDGDTGDWFLLAVLFVWLLTLLLAYLLGRWHLKPRVIELQMEREALHEQHDRDVAECTRAFDLHVQAQLECIKHIEEKTKLHRRMNDAAEDAQNDDQMMRRVIHEAKCLLDRALSEAEMHAADCPIDDDVFIAPNGCLSWMCSIPHHAQTAKLALWNDSSSRHRGLFSTT